MSGISMVFLKLLTELIAVDKLWERPGVAVILIASTFGTGFFQIHMLNSAMKMYEQLEVMPIYITLIMVVWMLTGIFIFNEIKYYSKTQLIVMGAAFAVCCVGIKCLTSKKVRQNLDHKSETPHSIIQSEEKC